MKRIKEKIERIVDKSDGKIIDKISFGLFILIGILTLYLFFSTFGIANKPVLTVHSKVLYTFILITNLLLFYFTMLGDVTSKPINRPRIFMLISIILGLCIYSMLVEIINQAFTNFLKNLIGLEEVPYYLIITNIRIMSIYVPILIVVLVLYESFKIPFKKESKKELLEYSIDILTRNINEISERTVNLKICEDIESGEDIILSESVSKQHTLIGGSSGSGKTALVLTPILAQLFNQKAVFRERLKELAFKCLEDDICYLKGPFTDKYINNNFSMDLIGIKEERRDEFLKIFKDLIIGIRESSSILYNDEIEEGTIKVALNNVRDIKSREINIMVFSAGYELEEYKYEYKDGILIGENVKNDDYSINISVKSNVKSEIDEETDTNNDEKEIELELCEISEELLIIDLKIENNNDKNKLSFKVNVNQHNEGKIIYRDLGVTVVAPDGGLPESTLKIAGQNGVKVHKIDPKMEEIQKGNIAKFNPLMVGTPEKAADVISSILVTMEQSTGNNSNPYFINACIRAIRNLVILLRVTYPKLRGQNPTLIDVLDILNDNNKVRDYVEVLQNDSRLEVRYKRVIDYFVTSFYPQPKDEKGTLSFATNEGVNRKKTSEAIQGMINQLDNLLGREELKYILCDPKEGMNLSDVLERGECLAIATRQSELGEILGKAFALMFILSMQNAVLCRYSETENPEIIHYLMIDELPFYLNEGLKVFFTFSRKYKCSVICAIQNIAQLCEESQVFKEIIFSNTGTKIILPGSNVEDRLYYSEMLGTENVFETQTGISQNPIFSEKANYSETTKGSIQEKNKISTQEISELSFKRCFYLYTNSKGKQRVGKGYIDFLKIDENNLVKQKYFHFSKFDYKIVKEEDFDKKVVNGDINTISAVQKSKEVNIYNDITELDVSSLEVFNTEEIQFSSGEEVQELKKTEKDVQPINFLEKKLLKVKNNDISNNSLNIKEKDEECIVDDKTTQKMTTKEETDIANIKFDELNIEGIQQK